MYLVQRCKNWEAPRFFRLRRYCRCPSASNTTSSHLSAPVAASLCHSGKLYLLWRAVGLDTGLFAAQVPNGCRNWPYILNSPMNPQNTLLTAALGMTEEAAIVALPVDPRILGGRMKMMLLIFLLAVFAGCADTEYYAYSGSGVYVGTGGASRSVDGVDLWVTGTPPRQFRIIGYITDERLGAPLAIAGRDRGMASKAKKAGGDGLLLTSEQTNGMGSYSTGSAMAFANGNTITATGTGVSLPIIQRQAKYYVIKYVQ